MKLYFFLWLLFCSTNKCFAQNIQLIISPVFNDKPITTNDWFITKKGDSIQLENMRFYISHLAFEMPNKRFVSDTVQARLVDIFEPNSLRIDLPDLELKSIKKIYFSLGIDSLTNVSGALSGDLDPQKGMYWAWQSGYINLKIEGKSPHCKTRKNIFQFHIGGYLSPFYALKNLELSIDNKNSSAENIVLKIEVSKFFETIDITTQNSIMIPCEKALKCAEYSTKMFSIYAQ
jgi:hypothetical protein